MSAANAFAWNGDAYEAVIRRLLTGAKKAVAQERHEEEDAFYLAVDYLASTPEFKYAVRTVKREFR